MGNERKITLIVDINSSEGSRKVKGFLQDIEKETKASNNRLSADERAKQKEVEAIHKETAKQAKQQAKLRESIEKERINAELQAEKRAEKEKIESFKNLSKEVKKTFNEIRQANKGASVFEQTFAGSFLGDIASDAWQGFLTQLKSLPTYFINAGKAVFDFVKQASDYGSIIKDFQDKTGLAVDVIQTLKVNLEASGLELSNFQKPLMSITKLMYEASHGSEEAIKTLKKFDVTNFGNFEQALGKILTKISDTKNESQKMGLAMEVAGTKGGGALRVLSENMPDFQKAIADARRLGLVLSQEDVKAADDFGDTLMVLETQTKALGARFALQFAPQITQAMNSISDVLSKNQKDITNWANQAANSTSRTVAFIKGLIIELRQFSGETGGSNFNITNNPAVSSPSVPWFRQWVQRETERLINQGYTGGGVTAGAGLAGSIGMGVTGRSSNTDDFGILDNSMSKDKKKKSGSTGLDSYASARVKAQFQDAMRNLSPALKSQIVAAAEQYGIPDAIAFAQIFSESSFKTNAVSPFNKSVGSSAYGLTQQLPATASKQLGVKVTGEMLKNNPTLALSAWGKYMVSLFNRYHDWELATLAYHQGEGTVDKLVALIDKGKSTDDFFKARPKGKAYIQKIGALAGLSGDQRFQTAREAMSATDLEKSQAVEDAIKTLMNARDIYGAEAVKIPQVAWSILDGTSSTAQALKDVPEAINKLIESASFIKNWTRDRLAVTADTGILFPDTETRSGNGGGISFTSSGYDEFPETSPFQRLLGSYQDGLSNARRGGRSMTAIEEATRQIEEYQKEFPPLTKAQKDQILATAAATDATEKYFETQQKVSDLFQNFFGDVLQGKWKSAFDGILGYFKSFLSQMAAQFVSSKIMKLLFGGGQTGSGGFGGLSNIFGGGGFGGFGGFGGGGNSGGFSIPGFGGMINFGGGGGGGAGGAGIFGGLKSSPFGGLLSKIPGLGGLFGLGGAGAGATMAVPGLAAGVPAMGVMPGAGAAAGLGGGGIMSSLGAMFTNPWTAVIAGGIIGGYFLGKWLFGDKSVKRLTEATKQLYSIGIDKKTAKSLKQIGEAYYGKGAGEKMPQGVVKLEESKELIRAYAEATGQDTSKLGASKADLQNEYYGGNRFVSKFGGFRQYGGNVQAGYSYIVGERRAELFTPSVNGHISPSAESNGASTQLLMTMIGAMMQTLNNFQQTYINVSPDSVLMATSPATIGAKVNQHSSANPRFNSDYRGNKNVSW